MDEQEEAKKEITSKVFTKSSGKTMDIERNVGAVGKLSRQARNENDCMSGNSELTNDGGGDKDKTMSNEEE